MGTKQHLSRIYALISENLAIDFFNYEVFSAEISNLGFLDDVTIDIIQAQVVHATSIRTVYDLNFKPFPNDTYLLEVVNYLGGLAISPAPEDSLGAMDILLKDFESKAYHWGRDFHNLLSLILAFDQSKNDRLEKSTYMLADLGYRALKEGRDSNES